MRYYRLNDDVNLENRWFLKSLNLVDEKKISVWEFTKPAKIVLPENEEIEIGIREDGLPLDFTFADFSVLIINEKVAAILPEDECQLLPLKIKGVKNKHIYFIAIIQKSIDCLDEKRSVFEKWKDDDPIRPDLAGQYKGIYKLFVDSNKISKTKIFRLGKSTNMIIVNEDIKKACELNKISGITFQDVT